MRWYFLQSAMMACLLLLVAVAVYNTGSTERGRSETLRALGVRLLGERRLDASGARSCLDCHVPALGYADGRVAAGPAGLNTPTLWGLAERKQFGWFDRGVTTLEAQVLRPLADPNEMGPQRASTLMRLREDTALVAMYRDAFPNTNELVTWEQTALALAAAVRAIPAPPSAYEQWLAGDAEALSAAALRGKALFVELGCAHCHQGMQFASDSFHSVGVGGTEALQGGRARVPSLRGVRFTAPYFHNGSAESLEAVIDVYAEGGGGGERSPAIVPFQLTEKERRELMAFLEAL